MKKIKIYIIFYLILNCIFLLEVYATNNINCYTLIVKNNGNLVSTKQLNYLLKYNTVYVDIDDIFNEISEIYGYSTNSNDLIEQLNKLFYYQKTTSPNLNNSHVAYRYEDISSYNFIIDKSNLVIKIPDIYKYKGTTNDNYIIDDSIEVEIIKVDDKYYVPLYFIANIPGVSVNVDGKDIYNENDYIDSINALSKTTSNIISLDITKIINYSNLLVNYDLNHYIGQQKGSLWREEAKKNIEKYRKKDVIFNVKDSENNIINVDNINITMLENDFKFGTVISKEFQNQELERLNRNYFNLIGSDNLFKINIYKNTDATLLEEQQRQLLNTAQQKVINNIRGHVLYWDKIESGIKYLITDNNGDNDLNNITLAYLYNHRNDNNIDELEEHYKQKFENEMLSYIELMVNKYPEIKEWDITNELRTSAYFSHYLYDRAYRDDNSFLTKKVYNPDKNGYTVNDDYIDFLVRCIDRFTSNTNAKVVLNENYIMPSKDTEEYYNQLLIILKKLYQKRGNKIDAFGVQYHVKGRSYLTPQSYNNVINYTIEQTGIQKAKITEYDHFIASDYSSNVDESGLDSLRINSLKRKERADYMHDVLIMAYSNPNIDEFTMYGFYWESLNNDNKIVPRFSYDDDNTIGEQSSYQNTVYDWLNYSEELTKKDDDKYITSLYKGKYKARVTINNKNYETEFYVTSDEDVITTNIIIPKEYNINFNSNGGSNTMDNQIVQENESVNLKKNTFTKTGYKFVEWNTESDGSGNSYENEEMVNINNDITLYAQWAPIKYYINFNSNYGSGEEDNVIQDFTYDVSNSLLKNTFAKDNYYFTGWNTKIDGTGNSYTDEEDILNLTDEDNSVIELYAQWQKGAEYTINDYTYDINKKIIKDIPSGTPLNEFKNKINLGTGTTIIVDTKKVNNKDVIYTGGKTKIYVGNELAIEFTNIVTGDANGDGDLSYLDYIVIYNHIQKSIYNDSNKKLLTEVYKIAADLSKDNEISYMDYVMVYNKIQKMLYPS